MTPDALPGAAELIALDIPAECLPGVSAALDGLADHLRILDGFDVPADGGE
jgi:hypothetical protein